MEAWILQRQLSSPFLIPITTFPETDGSAEVFIFQFSAFAAKKKNINGYEGQGANARPSAAAEDSKEPQMDIKSILKAIEFLGSSHKTWKQNKDLENSKVVSLSGKAPKRQQLPLSVARVRMKKQKDREEKMHEESAILRRFGVYASSSSTKKAVERRRPEDRVFKTTEGYFRNGILDVNHLLKRSTPRVNDNDIKHAIGKGKKKKGGKKIKEKEKEKVAVENDTKILRNCIIANLRNGEEFS